MKAIPCCPSCGSERLHATTIQVAYNTGAHWICLSCGTPVDADGTPNEVLVRQPVGEDEVDGQPQQATGVHSSSGGTR